MEVTLEEIRNSLRTLGHNEELWIDHWNGDDVPEYRITGVGEEFFLLINKSGDEEISMYPSNYGHLTVKLKEKFNDEPEITELSILETLNDLQTDFYTENNIILTRAVLPEREYNFLVEECKERMDKSTTPSMLTKPIRGGKLSVYLKLGMVEVEYNPIIEEITLL